MPVHPAIHIMTKQMQMNKYIICLSQQPKGTNQFYYEKLISSPSQRASIVCLDKQRVRGNIKIVNCHKTFIGINVPETGTRYGFQWVWAPFFGRKSAQCSTQTTTQGRQATVQMVGQSERCPYNVASCDNLKNVAIKHKVDSDCAYDLERMQSPRNFCV